MTEAGGPEGRRPPRRDRRMITVAVCVACASLVAWAGLTLNPARRLSGNDWTTVAQWIGMLVLVAASLASYRLKLGQMVKYALAWASIIGVLVIGYSFREELTGVGQRVRSELAPDAGIATGPNEFSIARDDDGHFYAMGAVNGEPVRFLIDTGASDIVLTRADAERLGLDPAKMTFSGAYETANGIGRGAAFTAGRLQVGPVGFSDVPVTINEAPMTTSLLGMAFLRRLDSFEVRGRRLYLRWRT